MSVRALSWSFGLRLDDMAAKSALHALADHADDAGLCWPSIARVALCMGCSESTARRALRRLVALGLVRSDASRGGAGITNRFVLNFDWQPTEKPCQDDAENPVNLEPCQDGTLSSCTNNPVILHKNPVNVHQNPVTLTPEPSRTVKEPSDEPPTERVREATDNAERPFKLTNEWQPSPDGVAHAVSHGLNPATVSEAFLDYFTEGRGKSEKRTHAGWQRRWKIWCNRDAQQYPRTPQAVRSAKRSSELAAFGRGALGLGRDEPIF